jgi:hypothetical protein
MVAVILRFTCVEEQKFAQESLKGLQEIQI